MATILKSQVFNANAKHESSMLASLEHRLAVAKANQNLQLIAMLEQEQQELASSKVVSAKILRSPFGHQKKLGIWDSLVKMFDHQAELQVSQISDRAGNVWWYAYDPQTGQSIYADSEAEMRVWIEQNYMSY